MAFVLCPQRGVLRHSVRRFERFARPEVWKTQHADEFQAGCGVSEPSAYAAPQRVSDRRETRGARTAKRRSHEHDRHFLGARRLNGFGDLVASLNVANVAVWDFRPQARADRRTSDESCVECRP